MNLEAEKILLKAALESLAAELRDCTTCIETANTLDRLNNIKDSYAHVLELLVEDRRTPTN